MRLSDTEQAIIKRKIEDLKDWAALATLDELKEESRAARFILLEADPKGFLYELTRRELGVLEREINRL